MARFEWRTSSILITAADGRWTRYLRVMVVREGALKLLPAGYELPADDNSAAAVSAATPGAPTGRIFKRGRKEYSDEQLEPFKIKFFLMLYENDVPAKATIVVDDYAKDLVDWGGRAGLDKVPGRSKMITEIGKWLPLWLSLIAFKD